MQRRRERRLETQPRTGAGRPKQGPVVYFVHALVDGMQKTLLLRYTDLADALEQACSLIRSGAVDVQIQDDRGHRVSGSELAACCRGERTLRPNLRTD